MNIHPDGQMIRRGIILLGYHSEAKAGDVLSVDGEVLGAWRTDDDEWCHFTIDGDSDVLKSAPSCWILDDLIADWYEKKFPSV